MDDLQVVSTCLQDAVAKIGDIAWLPAQRRFAMVVNRFVWESAKNRRHGPFARVRTGLHFDDVLGVQQRNIRPGAKDAVLSLLAVDYAGRDDEEGGVVTLHFSGGGSIRLDVEAVSAHMEDISDPWQTRSRPDHSEA